MNKIEEIRKSYQKHSLDLDGLDPDPIRQFGLWWADALAIEIVEPNAMTLATVDAQNKPSARTVLLKGYNADGFEFYTNYLSRKGEAIKANPAVALVFLWKELERQVRIEGLAEKISREKSEAYFQSRPRGSQIGAWASPQSQEIPDRNVLEENVKKIAAKYPGSDPLPCPEYWGGYLVRPHLIEFWQGRPDRMHDRFEYKKNPGNEIWVIERLAP